MIKNLIKLSILSLSTITIISCGPAELLIMSATSGSDKDRNRSNSDLTQSFEKSFNELGDAIGCGFSSILTMFPTEKVKISIEEEHLTQIAFPALESVQSKNLMSFYDNLNDDELDVIENYLYEAYRITEALYSDSEDLQFYRRLFVKSLIETKKFVEKYPKTTCWRFSQRLKKVDSDGVKYTSFSKLFLKIKDSSCSPRPEDKDPNDTRASAGTIRTLFCSK